MAAQLLGVQVLHEQRQGPHRTARCANQGAKWLRTMGMGQQVDELNLQINRVAEAAVPLSKKLIAQSIHNMSVQDAKGIWQGGENSMS